MCIQKTFLWPQLDSKVLHGYLRVIEKDWDTLKYYNISTLERPYLPQILDNKYIVYPILYYVLG